MDQGALASLFRWATNFEVSNAIRPYEFFRRLVSFEVRNATDDYLVLFYYHHINRTALVHTVFCLYYDPYLNEFWTYTLYEFNSGYQGSRQPFLADFKRAKYSNHEFEYKILHDINGFSRFPHHHFDKLSENNVLVYKSVLQGVGNVFASSYIQCEL